MTLKFNRVLEVAEIHVRAKFYEAKCSGSWVVNSELYFGHCRLRSRISLEWIKQSTSGERRYKRLFFSTPM